MYLLCHELSQYSYVFANVQGTIWKSFTVFRANQILFHFQP